jgi:RIO-like serine/threonine protein kinase
VIDWPQWIKSSEDNAIEILERDLGYIAEFFRKRFGLEIEAGELVKRIVGDYDEQ